MSVALALGAIQGGLGVLGAFVQNDAIEDAAQQNISAFNPQITRARVWAALQIVDNSRAGQRTMADARARINHFGSGMQTDARLATMAGDIRRNTIAVRTQLADAEDRFAQQKQAIAAAANSQTKSPFFEGLGGALTGYMQGAQIDSLLSAKKSAEAMGSMEAQIGVNRQAVGVLDLSTRSTYNGILDFRLNGLQDTIGRLEADIAQFQKAESGLFNLFNAGLQLDAK